MIMVVASAEVLAASKSCGAARSSAARFNPEPPKVTVSASFMLLPFLLARAQVNLNLTKNSPAIAARLDKRLKK
jgi:hypothetical protein